MPSSAETNFDPLALARRIIDLNAEVDREAGAGQYERAAHLRDQREGLERQLSEAGSATVVRNVKRGLRAGLTRAGVLSLLEQERSAIDVELLRHIRSAPVPPRWVLNGYAGSVSCDDREATERRCAGLRIISGATARAERDDAVQGDETNGVARGGHS
jgi:hypothetical protein